MVVDVPVIMQRQVGVSPTVKVPQIHFIVSSEEIPVVQQRRVQRSAVGLPFMAVMAAMKGVFRPFQAIFSQFALENLDIIFTCSHMAVGGGFSAALTHFSRSSGLSRS